MTLEAQSRDLVAFTHLFHLETNKFFAVLTYYSPAQRPPPPHPSLCPLCFIHNRSPALPPARLHYSLIYSLSGLLTPLFFPFSAAVLKPHQHRHIPSHGPATTPPPGPSPPISFSFRLFVHLTLCAVMASDHTGFCRPPFSARVRVCEGQ